MNTMLGAGNTKSFARKATLEDFFGDDDDTIDQSIQNNQNNQNKYNSHNDNEFIAKNQQEYGHRKRIKP
jgi:hypothetical protein